jgi:hypothetical protein
MSTPSADATIATATNTTTTTSSSKRKKKDKSGTEEPIEWHPFLTDLYALQSDAEHAWPFDLELQSEFTNAEDAESTLCAWTGAATCADWPIRFFATDGSGAQFGLYKGAVVCMGSEGGLGAYGDLQTFGMLLSHRLEPAEWLADSVDDAARRGYGEIDVDDVPLLTRNKSTAFAAIADLVKKHFDVDPRPIKLRTVLDRVAKPVSLRQFGQFLSTKIEYGKEGTKKKKKVVNEDDDDSE